MLDNVHETIKNTINNTKMHSYKIKESTYNHIIYYNEKQGSIHKLIIPIAHNQCVTKA